MSREFTQNNRILRWLSVIVLSCAAVGCGGSPDRYDGPHGEVEGTITFQGEPIPQGSTVMFQSSDRLGPTFIATGKVQEAGKYRLNYAGARRLPGVAYKVQITPAADTEPQAPLDTVNADPEELKPEAMIAAAKAKQESLPFPEKYVSLQTTPLTFTVEEGQNVADFELEK
jgi:hypothetical protein